MAAAASGSESTKLKAYLQEPLTNLHKAFYPGCSPPSGFCAGLAMWVIGNLLNNSTKYGLISLVQSIKALLALNNAFLAYENHNKTRNMASAFHGDMANSIVKASFEEDMKTPIAQAKIWFDQIAILQTPENSETLKSKGILDQQDTQDKPADAFGTVFNNEKYSAYSALHYAIYDQAEFAAFLNIVTIEMSQPPYLLISTLKHAVALWYDPSDEAWNIADANHGIGSTKKLPIIAKKTFTEIFHSTPENPLLNFRICFFDHSPIADRFATLKRGPAWKKLHKSPRHLEPTFRVEPLKTFHCGTTIISKRLSLKAVFDHINKILTKTIKELSAIQKDCPASDYLKVKREYLRNSLLQQLLKMLLYVLSEEIALPSGFTKDTGINKDTLLSLLCFFLRPTERQTYLTMILTQRDTLLSQIFWEQRGALPCSTSRGALKIVKDLYDAYLTKSRPSIFALVFGSSVTGTTASTSASSTETETPATLPNPILGASAEASQPRFDALPPVSGEWAL